MYFTVEDKCYIFTASDGNVNRVEIPALECQHEEADTRIIYHLYHIVSQDEDSISTTTIKIRCNDTGVFILLLYHIAKIIEIHGSVTKVWLDIGLSGWNKRCYIEINHIYRYFRQWTD